MAKRIGLLTLLTLFILIVVAVPGEIQASYPPEEEIGSPLPPSDVLLEKVPDEEAKAFLEKASGDPQLRLLIEALGEKGEAAFERATVKRATFRGQASTYALIPYISPQATYTLIYFAGNCTGAMAVNKEGGYYVRADQVRTFSLRDLFAKAPSIQDILATAPEGIKSSGIRQVSGAVLPLSADPQPLRECPECWEVVAYQCKGSCYALNCYGYCCNDPCGDDKGYCALTGPCWYGYNPACCSPSR